MFFDASSKEMTLLMFILVFSLLIVVFILPILGRLQPKIGTINLFPQCGSNKLILLKIMKRLILLFLVSLFYSGFPINLLADDYTISSNSTRLLFVTILILIAYGITSFIMSIVQASCNRNQ